MLQEEKPKKEHDMGPKINAILINLGFMVVMVKRKFNLEDIDSILSKIDHSYGKNLIWALKLAMLT